MSLCNIPIIPSALGLNQLLFLICGKKLWIADQGQRYSSICVIRKMGEHPVETMFRYWLLGLFRVCSYFLSKQEECSGANLFVVYSLFPIIGRVRRA